MKDVRGVERPTGDDGGYDRTIRIPARVERVASVRHDLGELLSDLGVASAVVEDLQLVVSELATNAVLHGTGDTVAVDIAVAHGDIVVAVTNGGPVTGIPAVADWRSAPPLATSGRGLGIVRRLSDDVQVRHQRGSATVVVRRHLPDAADARQSSS